MNKINKPIHLLSVFLTCLVAGITAGGALCAYISPEKVAWMSLLALAVPMLLLACVLLAFYWLFRRRHWVWIPLVAIALHSGYLTRIFQFPLFTPSSDPNGEVDLYLSGVVTVATYNVGGFYTERTGRTYKQVADRMRELRADILCFQEFGIHEDFGLDSLRHTFADWPYCYIPTSPSGERLLQLALFSRYPIGERELVVFPQSSNCAFWCDIDIEGRTIRLFNNHLQTTELNRQKRQFRRRMSYSEDVLQDTGRAMAGLADVMQANHRKRARQAFLISSLVAASPHPVLLCGDFNAVPSSYVYRTMRGGGLEDGFVSAGHGYMYTFRQMKKLLRIDYIFHSAEWNGVDYFSPNWDYSDHKPVLMRLTLH